MDILLVILGAANVALLLFLIIKKPSTENRIDLKPLEERLIRVEGSLEKLNPAIDHNFRENREEIAKNLDNISKTIDFRVKTLQEGNEKKLEAMRETVDEKLKASVEKRFNESFTAISKQLTEVYQGLGEMKNLATGVGDLKKVMVKSNLAPS